ncbi:MAG: hypothetical protein KY442_10595 [Proteobacteria bacterium]|nr:hypothetical protein [Pseudomonadota bacterium]
MRATRSSKNVEKWFAVTSARVGAEVNLAPDRRPLTRDRLREALGTDCVRESAHEHRIAVDRALYGLGPDRYDALIHLILQLRRPKLSEKLKPDTLAEHLADAAGTGRVASTLLQRYGADAFAIAATATASPDGSPEHPQAREVVRVIVGHADGTSGATWCELRRGSEGPRLTGLWETAG